MAFTNTINAGQNLSTIAQNAGMTPQAFAQLNPHLAATGANSYQGLNNLVQVGTGYNLKAPATTLPNGGAIGGATGGATVAPTIETPVGTFQSPETIAAQNAQANYLNTLTASAPDEAKIREQKLQEMQAAIDATNSMYADQLVRAKQVGAGRLGTTTAISARTGNLGSDFGNAQYNTQEQGNEDTYKSIENERLAKVNALLTQAKTDATSEIANKRAEFAKGLDSRLAYYQSADQRKTDNTSKAISAIIAKGLDPNSIDPTSLTSFAKYYGITPEDIKATYATEKAAYDQENNEALIKANPPFELSAGQQRNVFNPKTGKYEVVASMPKATGTTSGEKQTVASKEGTDVADIISFFKNKMTQNNWKGINPDDYNKYRTKLLKQYGSAAVNLLDKEIENSGLSVDNG